MITFLSTAFKTIGLKNIILGIFLIAALANYAYQNKKISSQNKTITTLNEDIEKEKVKLAQAQNDNKNIIEAYEKTLAIEREIAKETAIVKIEKEKVVKKITEYKQAVNLRGIVKDEKICNCTLVSFE